MPENLEGFQQIILRRNLIGLGNRCADGAKPVELQIFKKTTWPEEQSDASNFKERELISQVKVRTVRLASFWAQESSRGAFGPTVTPRVPYIVVVHDCDVVKYFSKAGDIGDRSTVCTLPESDSSCKYQFLSNR
jgi:hypothetical protein